MNEKLIKEIRKQKKKELKALRKLQEEKIKISGIEKMYCFACEHTAKHLVDLRKHILRNHLEYTFYEVRDYVDRIGAKINPIKKQKEKKKIHSVFFHKEEVRYL